MEKTPVKTDHIHQMLHAPLLPLLIHPSAEHIVVDTKIPGYLAYWNIGLLHQCAASCLYSGEYRLLWYMQYLS
jgi:hypothetical protein